MDNIENGWTMAIAIAIVCGLILALVHVPDFRPSDDVLACDGTGGVWSKHDGTCHKTNSPLAGLAA